MPDDLSSPVARALEHIESGDLPGAQRCLELESDSDTVSACYAELTRVLYARNKDVAGMLALGRAGIEYELRQAERAAAVDTALAVRLRTSAKTWPSTSRQTAGRDGAMTAL